MSRTKFLITIIYLKVLDIGETINLWAAMVYSQDLLI